MPIALTSNPYSVRWSASPDRAGTELLDHSPQAQIPERDHFGRGKWIVW